MAKTLFRDTFLIEKIDKSLIVEFAPDKSGNASYFTSKTLENLNVLVEFLEEQKLEAVIFAGQAFSVFSPGMCVKYLQDLKENNLGFHESQTGQKTFGRLASLHIPTIAAISGMCFGPALEIALACRYRLAAQGDFSQIAFNQAEYGLTPCFGGTQSLANLVDINLAHKMISTGCIVNGDEALEAGLVDEVVKVAKGDDNFYFNEVKRTALEVAKKQNLKPKRKRKLTNLIKSLKSSSISKSLKDKGQEELAVTALKVCKTGFAKGFHNGMIAESEAFTKLLANTDLI